jgi:hypothetical protein
MTLQALKTGRVNSARQDGSREFISLLACICADGSALPPALIYKGASGDLQSSWTDDLITEDQAFFTTSATGWSSDAHGLQWLQKVFDPATVQKAGRSRRLLIVDGHSSHINMAFLDMCDKLRILIMVLPPHSTHRLQPLDVSLFLPLATRYSQKIQQLLHQSDAITSITKRTFWSCFKPAWDSSFTEANILSGFRKTGIWPLEPTQVVNIIALEPSLPESSLQRLKTPVTAKGMRQFHKAYLANPSPSLVRQLFRANNVLATQAAIADHRAKGLLQALQIEKKKRQRSKRLGLTGKEMSGPQFFGVDEILTAKAFQEGKEAIKEQKIQDKEAEKELKLQEKQAAQLVREEKAAQVAVDRQISQNIKATEKEKKLAEKEARKQVQKYVKKSKKSLIIILLCGKDILLSLE